MKRRMFKRNALTEEIAGKIAEEIAGKFTG